MTINYKHIKTLVSKNELDEVFKQLELFMYSKFENEILLLKSRFDDFNKKSRMGIESQVNLNIEFAKINYSILQLISYLEDENLKPNLEDINLNIVDRAFRKKIYYEAQANNLNGKTLNGYKLIEQIGAGGFGNVYLSIHPMLDRYAATKVSYPIKNYKNIIFKLIEYSLDGLKNLNHDNIAKIIDVGETKIDNQDHFFIINEYVDGGNLRDYCIKNELKSTKDLDTRLIIFLQICYAISYSHKVKYFRNGFQTIGIQHGDIKQENILLTKDLKPKLTDFMFLDLQKLDVNVVFSPSFGTNGMTLAFGTIGYMPEEQAKRGIVSDVTDIYSLGILLFELVSNLSIVTLNKFEFNSIEEISDKINNTLIPQYIINLIYKLTRINPEDRIQDVSEIINILESQ
jgi:serine/threonine protein kinase